MSPSGSCPHCCEQGDWVGVEVSIPSNRPRCQRMTGDGPVQGRWAPLYVMDARSSLAEQSPTQGGQRRDLAVTAGSGRERLSAPLYLGPQVRVIQKR